jgi:hypothetical protein
MVGIMIVMMDGTLPWVWHQSQYQLMEARGTLQTNTFSQVVISLFYRSMT